MADQSYLSWPFLDDAHRAWMAQLEKWTSGSMPALPGHHEETREAVSDAVCRLVKAMGAGGLLTPCVPAEYGGRAPGSFDTRALCLSREHLARVSGLADYAFAMQGLGSAPITIAGTDAQKKQWLPKVVTGEAIAAFALSEADAGSDVGAMSTTARLDGDHYVIDGAKTWISNGGIANVYTLFARTGEAPGTKGISAFIVPGDTPGLDASEYIPIIAPHPLATVTFTNCRIPATNILGKPGEGFKTAMATLDVFRSTVGAAALGFARRALDEGLARTKARKMFGQTLADFQITQSKLAEMALSIDASALLIYRAAWTRDVLKRRVTREASMAKLFATESAQQVIDAALQMFGGLGVVTGMTVESLYREIRALRIYEGASEVQKLIIASTLLKDS